MRPLRQSRVGGAEGRACWRPGATSAGPRRRISSIRELRAVTSSCAVNEAQPCCMVSYRAVERSPRSSKWPPKMPRTHSRAQSELATRRGSRRPFRCQLRGPSEGEPRALPASEDHTLVTPPRKCAGMNREHHEPVSSTNSPRILCRLENVPVALHARVVTWSRKSLAWRARCSRRAVVIRYQRVRYASRARLRIDARC